jgi:hypothetical protein
LRFRQQICIDPEKVDEHKAGSLVGWGDVILTGKEVVDQIEKVKYQPKSVQKAKTIRWFI